MVCARGNTRVYREDVGVQLRYRPSKDEVLRCTPLCRLPRTVPPRPGVLVRIVEAVFTVLHSSSGPPGSIELQRAARDAGVAKHPPFSRW
jgi:hypothetical protein